MIAAHGSFRTACALLLNFALLPALAAAQEGPPRPVALTQLSLEELANLPVVSVSKVPHEAWNTAAAIFVLTAADIRQSGATSVPEVLRLVPGVQVSRIDTTHWAVGIRGLTSQFSRALLVLVDGRSVYTPLFAGVYWDVQDLPLEEVDRIEVIRGPGGTIWGANAMQGVINIITKDARDTTGTLASVTAGTLDHTVANVRFGRSLGTRAAYRVSAQGFRRGPQRHADDAAFDRWTMGRVGFRMDGERRPGETFSLQAAGYGGDAGERVSVGMFTPPAQVDLDGPDVVAGGHVLARWRRAFEGGGHVQVQGFVDRTSRRAPHYREVRHTMDVDLVHRQPLPGRQQLVWGAGARVSPSRITQLVPTLTFTDLEPHDRVYSLFVQDEVALRPDVLTVTFGAKIEHEVHTGVEVQPSLRGMWRPARAHALWAGITRAVRTPSHLDRAIELTGILQAADPAIFLRIAGNPDLAPERSVGTEIGYRTLLTPALSIETTVFRTRYDGLLSFGFPATTVEPLPIAHVRLAFPFVNGMDGSASGVEISPTWQPAGRWQIRGGYSFLRMHLENTPASPDTTTVENTETSSPRHQVFVQSVLSPGTWELVQTYRAVSALPAQRAGAFHAVDFRVGWRATRRLELAVSGHNLLDRSHPEFDHPSGSTSAVGIRRTMSASLIWRP